MWADLTFKVVKMTSKNYISRTFRNFLTDISINKKNSSHYYKHKNSCNLAIHSKYMKKL